MIEISFKAFHDQDYRERGYKLYVLKNGNEDVLYVGISTRSIWERWFGMNGHILWTDRYATGESEVVKRLWIICQIPCSGRSSCGRLKIAYHFAKICSHQKDHLQ